MRSIRIQHTLVSIFCIGIAFSQATPGQGRGQGPKAPAIPGQVAVYATPDLLDGETVLKVLPHAGIAVVAVRRGEEEAHAHRFRSMGLRAGVNRLVQASEVPNDPFFSYQWNLPRIRSEEAWDLTDGEGVIVAVVDTGLATGGTDGIGCVSPGGYDVVNQDNDPNDGDGHGTHVAGTIAQATNNAIGVAGLSNGACVLPVKVLDDSGSGSTADIAEGVVYAAQNGAKVINMSLGIDAKYNLRNDAIMDPALDYADQMGVTVVCAAGNEGVDTNVGYPAIYPTTVAVGATDFADMITSYSNAGFGIDIVAPGGDTSADLNGDGYTDGILQETRIDGEWGYYFFQGTSMASPHVAAVAALLIGNGTATTPDEVYAAMTSSALDLGAPGYDAVYGHGLVQAYSALNGTIPEPPPPPACTDEDGDGVCVEDGDCNDSDSTIYPGALDSRKRIDRNGIDNDCDGLIDR